MRDSAPSRRMLRAAAPAARTGSVLKKTVAAGAVLGVAAAAYGHFIELNNFVVRHERLPVLPAGRQICDPAHFGYAHDSGAGT